MVVGLNLSFDISRIATSHGTAKGMPGAFSFKLAERRPGFRIKHLNSRASIFNYAAPGRQRQSKGQRKRKVPTPHWRGHAVEVRALASALLGGGHSLASLTKLLDTPTKKDEKFENYDGPVNDEYLEYLETDVQATWECYETLLSRLAEFGLDIYPSKVYSEASIGKACLAAMGIRPWGEVQPDFDPALVGIAMSAYSGGRAEVGIRREVTQVVYADFKSMYTTVATNLGLWRFVIAAGIKTEDATDWARDFLDGVTLEDLADPRTWAKLCVLVRVRPDGDVFPVRARYGDLDSSSETETPANHQIGLNYETSDKPLWVTLADAINSKLRSGKAPEVIEAIRFSPGEPQEGLRSYSFGGEDGFEVDPYSDDLYRRLIDLRDQIKTQRDRAKPKSAEYDRLDAFQGSIKTLASSTVYGIFVELNTQPVTETRTGKDGKPRKRKIKKQLTCYGYTGESFETPSLGISEKPGRYFHPVLAAFVTGGARLMLGIAESLIEEKGLGWAFCDTDSMAIARPEAMSAREFCQKAEEVMAYFDSLNPYSSGGSLFEEEDENFSLTKKGKASKRRRPLYCLAISAKRYALFNIDADGRPVIRKFSAHGLGHLFPPYEDEDAPEQIPPPVFDLKKAGLKRWEYDLWYQITLGAVEGHPDQVDLSAIPGLGKPAASRYAATTPEVLAWFDAYNNEKSSYREKVRPFGFLLAFQVDPLKRQGHEPIPRPVAPFDKDPAKAAEKCFDRLTGEPVDAESLLTYERALAQYHLHPEEKFLGGDYLDRGPTRRRHLRVTLVEHIGKEANRWEEQSFLGSDDDALLELGSDPAELEALATSLRAECAEFSVREIEEAGGPSKSQMALFMSGKPPSRSGLLAISRALRRLS